jgi:hypothetical protein
MCCRRGFIDYAQGIDSRAIPREKEHVNQSIEELKDMNLVPSGRRGFIKNIIDTDLVADRQAVCDECEHKIELTNQCNLCYCFIALKAALPSASCPAGKWTR